MNLEEFNNNVLYWAKKRGLIDKKNVPKQLMKTMEELGELSSAILKKKDTEIMDGIGDVIVCISILSEQLGFDIHDCIGHAWNDIKDRTGRTIDGNFIKSEDL